MDEDTQLMLEFKNGNISAFENLFKKYKRIVLNIIYRYLGNSSEAEDLAQEVFLKIYFGAKKYEPLSAFSTWLYRITANLCLDTIRKKKSAELPENVPDLSLGPEQEYKKKKLEELVKNALDRLSPNERIAVILARYENKNMKEIAEIMNVSVSAVKSILHRAKFKLKDYLEPRI